MNPSRPQLPDEYGLHGVDAVDTDDLGVRHDRDSAPDAVHGAAERTTELARGAGVARAHHDENALTVPDRLERDGEKSVASTAENEIDGPTHDVGLAVAGPPRSKGPLSGRRNASRWRSSDGVGPGGRAVASVAT